MSIDGPGVIESDLGHDVYNDFVAAAAKAFWEIGHAQEDLRARLADLIASGRSSAQWERGDSKLARARAAVVARLLRQIGTARAKPRPRKKYAAISQKLFRVGDCLSLDLGGETHRGIVGKIHEYRGRCEYMLLVMEKGTGASLEAFSNGRYYGRRIPAFGLERPFTLGPHVIRLDHRMLLREGNPFVVAGNLPLDEQRFMPGSFGGVMNLGDVVYDFNLTEQNPVGMRNDLLPIRDLLEDSSPC